MPKRWLVKKEIACCVRGHVYLDIWAAAIREVLVCSTEPTNVGCCKIYSRKIFLYVFGVRKYFYSENKANYGTFQICTRAKALMFRVKVDTMDPSLSNSTMVALLNTTADNDRQGQAAHR